MYIKAWRNIRYFAGGTKPHCGRGRECPCFAVCALVCDLFPKGECVPTLPVKASGGRLCEKLKNGMRSGLDQRCGGNFLAIFAGTLLDEKPNFTGGFFRWRRPFDFSTMIKEGGRKRPPSAHKAPQCGAFQGFEAAVLCAP